MSKINYNHETSNIMEAIGIKEEDFNQLAMAVHSHVHSYLNENKEDHVNLSGATAGAIQQLEIELERDLQEYEILAIGIMLGQALGKLKVEQLIHEQL